MNRFTLALAAALAFVNFSAAAGQVDVLKAHNFTTSHYGIGQQNLGVEVRVDNLAFAKTVEVVYRDSDNQWKTVPASFKRSVGSTQEIWAADWVRITSSLTTAVPAINLEFAVKYQVNGQTYWDNNGGQNHKVNLNTGEYITKPVLADSATANAPYDYNYDGNTGHVKGVFSVGALLKNLAHTKEVKVHYSYDNWATTHVGTATFQPSRTIAYAPPLSYPNANGVELWSFFTNGAVAQNTTATSVKYAVSYKVNGVTYWDNNFGQNYSVTIVKN